MGFWKKLFNHGNRDENINNTSSENKLAYPKEQSFAEYPNMRPVTGEEKDLVSVICSIIAAGNSPSTQVKIRHVFRLDNGKQELTAEEVKALISAAGKA